MPTFDEHVSAARAAADSAKASADAAREAHRARQATYRVPESALRFAASMRAARVRMSPAVVEYRGWPIGVTGVWTLDAPSSHGELAVTRDGHLVRVDRSSHYRVRRTSPAPAVAVERAGMRFRPARWPEFSESFHGRMLAERLVEAGADLVDGLP